MKALLKIAGGINMDDPHIRRAVMGSPGEKFKLPGKSSKKKKKKKKKNNLAAKINKRLGIGRLRKPPLKNR